VPPAPPLRPARSRANPVAAPAPRLPSPLSPPRAPTTPRAIRTAQRRAAPPSRRTTRPAARRPCRAARTTAPHHPARTAQPAPPPVPRRLCRPHRAARTAARTAQPAPRGQRHMHPFCHTCHGRSPSGECKTPRGLMNVSLGRIDGHQTHIHRHDHRPSGVREGRAGPTVSRCGWGGQRCRGAAALDSTGARPEANSRRKFWNWPLSPARSAASAPHGPASRGDERRTRRPEPTRRIDRADDRRAASRGPPRRTGRGGLAGADWQGGLTGGARRAGRVAGQGVLTSGALVAPRGEAGEPRWADWTGESRS
jgi:cytochrome c5